MELTQKDLDKLIQDGVAAEVQKRVPVSFEDIKPEEMKAVLKDSKDTATYVNSLRDDMADIKAKLGEVQGSFANYKELLAESRAQQGKVMPEDAEIVKSNLIASAPPTLVNAETRQRAIDHLKEAKAYFNNATTNSEGAYTVPGGVSRSMLSIALAYSVAMQDARIEPMATGQGSLKIPLDFEGGAVSYPGEGVSANAGEAVFGVATLTPKRRIAKLIATRELLDMSAVDIMAFFGQRLGVLFANDTDKQAFAGTGTPMTGLRGAATLIPKVIEAATFAPTANEVIATPGLLDDVDDTNLKWYMTRSVHWGVFGAVQDTTSGNRIIGMSDIPSLAGRQLLGFPVRYLRSDAAYAIGDSALSLVFAHLADLQRALVLANFGVTRMVVSEEAYIKDSNGDMVSLWDQGLFGVKMEGYFTGICPDYYTVLAKAPGVNLTSDAT